MWVLMELGIKLEAGGMVLYGRERIGKGGEKFQNRKCRSVIPDSDHDYGSPQTGESEE